MDPISAALVGAGGGAALGIGLEKARAYVRRKAADPSKRRPLSSQAFRVTDTPTELELRPGRYRFQSSRVELILTVAYGDTNAQLIVRPGGDQEFIVDAGDKLSAIAPEGQVGSLLCTEIG